MAEKKLTYGDVWETLSKVDVSKHTEEKMKLTYLSWSRMWMLLCEHYPQAQYEFVDFNGVPYKTLPDGTAEVVTRIMIDDLVREMRLPVMDYKNNPVVNPHARQVSDNAMRCLVKCVAMFGLGISVFTGMADETLPDEAKDEQPKEKKTPPKKAEPVEAEPVKEEVVEEDGMGSKGWADAFVHGFVETLTLHTTREQVVDAYKSNSEAVGTLKDKFPKHKEALDVAIKEFITNLPKEVKDD
jgi:hypothetical protein